MNSRTLAALAVFVACIANSTVGAETATDKDKAAAVKGDLKALQGEWVMESGSADGIELPELMAKDMRRICKGDETTAFMGKRPYLKAKITIDPTKEPKTIDYEMTEGVTKGRLNLASTNSTATSSPLASAARARSAPATSQPNPAMAGRCRYGNG
jgi:uncharacterized protein (TIGR03067 family)